MENKEVEKTYVSNCCGQEVDNILWVGKVGLARCPQCHESCTVEVLEEE